MRTEEIRGEGERENERNSERGEETVRRREKVFYWAGSALSACWECNGLDLIKPGQ